MLKTTGKRDFDLMGSSVGVATFPEFICADKIKRSLEEIIPLCDQAFVSDKEHNVYLETERTGADQEGPRGVFMRTQVGSVAYDELGETSTVAALYEDERLTRFIRAVLGKKEDELFLLADPIGAATINVFQPGMKHSWHFDESEYTTTLCLQMSSEGGDFVYTEPLRSSSDDMAESKVTAALDGKCQTHTLEFNPGTLALFAGRYSLHKVKEVYGEKPRLVAVFCYADSKGFKNSPSVQKQFWGRTKL